MKKIAFSVIALLSCICLCARVRIDVQGAGGATVKSIQAEGFSLVTVPAKATENITRAVLLSGNLNDQWKKFEFSFIPEKSGRIGLRFHTPGARNVNSIKPVLVDDVKVDGGTLLNGGFEIMKKDKLANWGLGEKGSIITGEKAFEGKQCVQVFFSRGMATQAVVVTGGEKVTVTFMAKSAK